jgi:hypothetical protein
MSVLSKVQLSDAGMITPNAGRSLGSRQKARLPVPSLAIRSGVGRSSGQYSDERSQTLGKSAAI